MVDSSVVLYIIEYIASLLFCSLLFNTDSFVDLSVRRLISVKVLLHVQPQH
jgi:hypothetical protein